MQSSRKTGAPMPGAKVVPIRSAAAAPAERPLFRPAPERPKPSGELLDLRLSEELDCIGRHIDQFARLLAADPILLHRHGLALRQMMANARLVEQISSVVRAADKVEATQRLSVPELKARLTRQAIDPLVAKH